MVPADDQAMVLPWASVMVIMVLLKLAFTCATPEAMFLRSRRRTRVASLPIHDPFVGRLPKNAQPALPCSEPSGFLLAGNRLRRPLAGPGIGVGPLAANR